jgi:hypothetical protein
MMVHLIEAMMEYTLYGQTKKIIQMTNKEIIINRIKSVIKEYGSFAPANYSVDCPVYASISKDQNFLVESLDISGGVVVEYVHETEVHDIHIEYDRMGEEFLEEEILPLVELHFDQSTQTV